MNDLATATFTQLGYGKRTNEDSFSSMPERGLFLICDGVSSGGNGDFASQLAANYLSDQLVNLTAQTIDQFLNYCVSLIQNANAILIDEAATKFGRQGCSTTVLVCQLIGDHIAVVNVGDTRAYLIADSAVQLSTDHTLAQRMLDRGAPAPSIPTDATGKLWQSIGSRSRVVPSTFFVRCERGDRILLCSDGLYSHASPQQLTELSSSAAKASTFARTLQRLVVDRKGSDDATGIVVDIV